MHEETIGLWLQNITVVMCDTYILWRVPWSFVIHIFCDVYRGHVWYIYSVTCTVVMCDTYILW
jgi:hypothetical protein